MSNINQLSGAIKFALLVGASATFASVSAFAQSEAAKAEVKEIEKITVTGSKIKRAVEEEGSSEVVIVSRAAIEATGLNNVADVLSSLAAVDGSGLSTVTTQTNGSDGSQQISLRNLGAQRTLVLVDGNRWATDPSQVVDLSTIPVSIIERIEILKDGASAIYGSDAIAGVVNLITRKNFEGAQAGLYYGQTSKGDGGRTGVDVTIGANGERSNSVLSVSYSSQDEIYSANRTRTQFPVFGNFGNWTYGQDYITLYNATYGTSVPPISSNASCANLLNNNTATYDSLGLGMAGFCGSGSPQYGRFTVGAGGTVAAGSYSFDHTSNASLTDTTPVAGTLLTGANYHRFQAADRYNFAPINYLQQPAERLNISGFSRFDFNDNLSGWVKASYTKRTSAQQLAEVPLTIANSGSQGPQWKFQVAQTSIFNPFGVAISTANYRMSVAGPRHNEFDYDTYSLQMGLEGNFTAGDRTYNWDLLASSNDTQQDTQGDNYINLFNLKNALGQSGYDAATNSLYCGATYATRIQGCTPFNIFGGPNAGLGYAIPGAPLNPDGSVRVLTAAELAAAVNYVSYTLVGTGGNSTSNFKADISGDLFELPGGMSGFAAGWEYRKDDAFVTPDSLVSEGGSSTNFSAPTQGQVSLNEFYVEGLFPILKDVTGAQLLEVGLAWRYTDYNAQGLADSNPVDADVSTSYIVKPSITNDAAKIGIKWKPIDDLLVRASWGETFRAPSATDLFGGVGESFPQAQDPCQASRYALLSVNQKAACDGQTGLVGVGAPNQPNAQIRAYVGSNVALTPEQGQNVSLGFVYSPSQLENFNISVDLWNVQLEDAITNNSASTVNGLCITDLVQGTTTGQVLNDPVACASMLRDATGFLVNYNLIPYNLQGIETSGIDMGVNYKYDTSFGVWKFQWDTTYTQKYETTTLNGNGENTGKYTGTAYWRWRSNFNIGWAMGDFYGSTTTRFLSDVYENCLTWCNSRSNDVSHYGQVKNHTGDYAVQDIQFGWKAPWDAKIAIGARNLFGREPPILTNNTFAQSFDAAYDLPGGAYWYAQYRQDF